MKTFYDAINIQIIVWRVPLPKSLKQAYPPPERRLATSAACQGTGLGLSVSYFIIVKEHGGEMDVTSEPEKGTTFILKLPLVPTAGS